MTSYNDLKSFYDSTLICFIDSPDTYFKEGAHLYIITAANPFSRSQKQVLNRNSNKKLETDLVNMDLVFGKCIGGSVDGAWQEESFWVICTKEEVLTSLGRTYKQNAIYKAKSPYDIQVIWLSDKQ